jgi:hypothetical protein
MFGTSLGIESMLPCIILVDSVGDPHWFKYELDPAFNVNADPDPGSQTNADTGPDPGQICTLKKVEFLTEKFTFMYVGNR